TTETETSVKPASKNGIITETGDAAFSDSSQIISQPTVSIGPDPLAGDTQGGTDASLWKFALAAFLAGLAALLTPCVFPVIPMTVTYFTKQENGKKKALLYGAFIILIYTFIGVIVSRLNGPAFANFLSTHWIPNVLFFLIFFMFGLAFLGMFEIVIPSSLINKIDSKADQ